MVRVAVAAALLSCVALGARPAAGHPVAQGALVIVLASDRVSVHATVSGEEVLVAEAFGGREPASLLEMQRRHGDYLLGHFRVTGDGRLLSGRVVRRPETPAGRPTYELEYVGAPTAPARILLEQNVLREFAFAPGNPWEATYVVRVVRSDRVLGDGLLLTSWQPLVIEATSPTGGDGSSARVDTGRMARDYVRHGIAHILTGYDHLLFVVALVLAVLTWWDLVKVVSAFTVAHSITLTLAVLNIVRVPREIVEPVIAASIVVVALSNVLVPARVRGAGRLGVAFLFGLFHGLGFAGGLLAAMEGMAGVAIGVAIAGFSVGVEIGHTLVVLPVFGLLTLTRRQPGPRFTMIRQRVLQYGSAAISLAGLVYLVETLR